MSGLHQKILTILKGASKQGDVKLVAKETGFSRQWVGLCLSPHKEEYSQQVVDALIRILKDRKMAAQQKEKKDEEALELLNELFSE